MDYFRSLIAIGILLTVSMCAQAQQTVFVPVCTGTASADTAKFTAIKSIVGPTNPVTIQLPYKGDITKRCKVSNLTLTANITLDGTNGEIAVVTGQTLTVVGPVIAPARLLFVNATAGLGTVSFSGNKVIGFVRPEWLGAVTGTGNTQAVRLVNRAATQAAITAALTAVTPTLLLPPALEVEFDVSNTGLFIAGNLRVVGQGQYQSTIRCYPESPSFAFNLFQITGGTNFELSDLAMQGPTNPGASGASNQATHAVYYVSNASAGSVTMRRFRITEKFYEGFQITSGSGGSSGQVNVDMSDFDITASLQGCSVFSQNGVVKQIVARNGYIHDLDDFAGLSGHGLYLHPNVSADIDNVRFDNNFYYAIHHYSASGVTGTPKFARYSNIYLGPGQARGILTTQNGLAEIDHLTSYAISVPVQFQNAGILTNSTINGSASSDAVSTFGGGGAYTYIIDNCQLLNAGTGILTAGAGSTWRISNSVFNNTGLYNIDCSTDALTLDIDNCRTLGSATVGLGANKGTIRVNNTVFNGTGTAISQDAGGGVSTLVSLLLLNSEITSNQNASINVSTSTFGKIRAVNTLITPFSNLTGAVYEFIELVPGISTSSLASGASITLPTFNFNVYHVTGVAAIDNIYVQSSGARTNMASGPLHLIADSAWTMTAAGNIKPVTLAARTAGQSYLFIHDPVTGFWNELEGDDLANPGPIGGGTPAAGTFTTLISTGGALNGTVGATTPAAGVFTTLSAPTSVTSALFKSSVAKILLQGTGTGASQLTVTQTTPPTCSTNCGTSPSVVGTDTFMRATMGASGSPASGFVVTFNGTWAAAPVCVASMATTGMVVGKLPLTVVTTTTTITIVTNGTAPSNSDTYAIHCGGIQ